MSTKAAVQTTLVPTPGLVVDNPSPQGGPALFCLFTQDWLTLQTFIVQALQLPISIGDFKAKYGDFTDESDIEGCVAAMQNVQGLSADFGDPMALLKELATNPAILQTPTAPPQLYLHIVWFATQLYETATTFNQTLGQFMELLNSTPADQRQALVVEILTGQGGLQSSAQTMAGLANDLNQAMAQFNLKLQPAATTFASYSSNESKFYKDVQAAITTDLNDVTTYQSAADDAFKLWRDLTISAVTVSIGLMVITLGMGWPLAAIAAGVLGAEAKKARDAYDEAEDEIQGAEADEQKKINLKTDLDGLHPYMAPAGPVTSPPTPSKSVLVAAQSFQDTLAQVEGVWLNIANGLAYIATTFTPAQFDNLPVWKEAMKLDDATQDWQTIAGKADEYTANSLVTYHIVPFGGTLPPDPQ